MSWVEEEFVRRREVLDSEHVAKRDRLERERMRELEELSLWREQSLATVAAATANARDEAES